MIKIGDKVKNFKLKDADNNEHQLSDYLGKKVVLYVYPKNNTPGCNSQACSFNDQIDLYHKNDIVILGISKDSPQSHLDFKNKFDLKFKTLSDESLEVIKYLGAYGDKKMFGKTYKGVKRMTFIIDEKGYLIHFMPKVNAKDNAVDVLNYLKNIK